MLLGQHFPTGVRRVLSCQSLCSLNLRLAYFGVKVGEGAIFAFEIKTDNKKTGGKISTTKHVDYINREGKYKDIDQKDLERMATENYITGSRLLEHQPGGEILLYSSPFGVIKQDDRGIKVSRQASNQTLAIAMLLAQKIYGDDIILHGDERFVGRSIRIAQKMKLGMSFANSMSKQQEQEKELMENDRRGFVQSGGRIVETIKSGGDGASTGNATRPGGRRETLSEFVTGRGNNQPYPTSSTITEKAKGGFCVPVLSGGTMDVSGQHTDVLLSKDEYDDLQRSIGERHKTYPKLRWDVSGCDGAVARAIVEEISENLSNHLDKTFAASHVQYINRESRFKQRGDCTAKGNHLPEWANGSPKKFFDAADKYESKNGERYKEIVFSLPNELNTAQQKEIIQGFLDKHLSDYYHAWAIHDKIGSMSNGERHTHVHIMFSTRKLDEYEHTVGREPQQFFKRAANEPEKGGCKKAEVWNGKNRFRHVSLMREDLAIIQNEVLRKYGYEIEVDHRTLKARREEALAQGNTFLAEILDRVPEDAIGPNALLDENSEQYKTQKSLRKYNASKNELKIVKNIMFCNIELEKIDRDLKDNTDSFREIQQELLPEEKEKFAVQLKKINDLGHRIQDLRSTLLTSSDAITEARLAHMSTIEKEQWHEFCRLGQELKNWQEFSKTIIPEKLEKGAYGELLRNIQEEESGIRKKLLALAPEIRKVSERLCNSSKHESIQIMAGEKIFANSFTRKKLQTLLLEQKKEIGEFSLLYQAKHKDDAEKGYTAETIVESLAGNLGDLYKQSKELRGQLKELRLKVISPERALMMAKNNYIGYLMKRQQGAVFKNYAALRKIKKEISKDGKPDAGKLELLETVERQEKIWDAVCASPAAQNQINKIMAGILQKNSAIAVKYARLNSNYKAVQGKIENLQALAKSAKGQGGGVRYKMSSPTSIGRDAPKIAAAIAGDVKFAPLVMKSKNEEDDDWELLTEAEKEEIRGRGR